MGGGHSQSAGAYPASSPAGRVWAEQIGVPDSEKHRWLRAVWLHDALRDASPEELEKWAADSPGPPELRHGPASAGRARAEGEDRPRRAGCGAGTTLWDWPNGTWSAAFYIVRITSIPGGRSSGSTSRVGSTVARRSARCSPRSRTRSYFPHHRIWMARSRAYIPILEQYRRPLAGARARRRLAAAGAGSGALASGASQAGAHLCRLLL